MELQSKRAFAPVAAAMEIGRKVENFMVDVDRRRCLVLYRIGVELECDGDKITGNLGLFIPGSLRKNGLAS